MNSSSFHFHFHYADGKAVTQTQKTRRNYLTRWFTTNSILLFVVVGLLNRRHKQAEVK